MKKKIITIAALAAISASSCKEHGVSINSDNLAEDTTYVAALEQAEQKNFLMEELSGVRCPNCPEGAVKMEELNKQNDHRLKIVTVHFGHLAVPITHREPKSEQDLRSDHGTKAVRMVFAEEGSMPCTATDRWQGDGNEGNKFFVSGSGNWANAIAKMKAKSNTTPVNVKITSEFNTGKNQYDITVTLHYTKAVTGTNVLSIFITENNIKEAFVYSDTLITYDHVMRKALTAPEGRVILDKFPTKEAGRVYIYRTALTIDSSDPIARKWEPDNMKVLAFVSAAEPDDKHVYQVQEIDLKK